jgi:sugar-phosphatase
VNPAPAWRARGLLFDLDGTLVDSAAAIDKVWSQAAQRLALPPQEVLAALPGRTAKDILSGFLDDPALIEHETRLIAQAQLQAGAMAAMPGAAPLLAALPAWSWAVVTAAPRDVALARLRAARLPPPVVLVAAEDVQHGKPHPQGYLLGAERLGQRSQNAEISQDFVVIEDAQVGVRAGTAAGMRVIGVGAAPTGAPTVVDKLTWFADVGDEDGRHVRWRLERPR